MKQTPAVRRVSRRGGSVCVTLSPAATRTLNVTPGGGVYEVITNDRTVELQPLAPPTGGARRRRYLSNRVRNVERKLARLRARARESYQAGYAEGFAHGALFDLRRVFIRLERVLPTLERIAEAAEPSIPPTRITRRLVPTVGQATSPATPGDDRRRPGAADPGTCLVARAPTTTGPRATAADGEPARPNGRTPAARIGTGLRAARSRPRAAPMLPACPPQ